MLPLSYLQGYAPALLQRVLPLLEQGLVIDRVVRRHGPPHPVRTDADLYDYVNVLKQRFMRKAGPISTVAYDPKLQLVQQALGTYTRVSRLQGSRLKAKREIRIASLFRQAPEPFLKMIVVHELAHLKEREHDKAFYALCTHMEPDYHALEFDVRLWLCALEFDASSPARRAPSAPQPLGHA